MARGSSNDHLNRTPPGRFGSRPGRFVHLPLRRSELLVREPPNPRDDEHGGDGDVRYEKHDCDRGLDVLVIEAGRKTLEIVEIQIANREHLREDEDEQTADVEHIEER